MIESLWPLSVNFLETKIIAGRRAMSLRGQNVESVMFVVIKIIRNYDRKWAGLSDYESRGL